MDWLRSSILVTVCVWSGCVIDLPDDDPDLRDDEWPLVGDGEEGSEGRSPDAFTRIVHRSAVRVDVHVDPTRDEPSILVSCDRNLLFYVDTRVADGRLLIQDRHELAPRAACDVRVSTPHLVSLENRGDGVLEASGDIATLERIQTTKSGYTRVHDLEVDALEVIADDISSVRLSGGVETLRIETSSRGEVRARDLVAKCVDVLSTDSGPVSVRALECVSGELRGDGDIEVFGEPEGLELSQDGSGEILLR